MKIKWQMTKEEQVAVTGLDIIKQEYAKKVGDFIQNLPPQFQHVGYYESVDVVFEVVIALGRLNAVIIERNKKGES